MSKPKPIGARALTRAGSFALLFLLAGGISGGCKMGSPLGGEGDKGHGGAMSAKDEKAAGRTIHGMLKKNASKASDRSHAAQASSGDRGGRSHGANGGGGGGGKGHAPDDRAPAIAPMPIPEVNYAAMDTAKLAAIMEDILVTPEPYYYSNGTARDVFEPLVKPGKDADDGTSSNDLKIVGILWGEHDRFALAEAPDGRCRILREGDMLGDGYVVRISPDKVIIHVTQYGTSRNVTLPLVQGGGADENPRSRGR